MKPLRIYRHHAGEGPGYLTTVLDRENLPYELIAIDQGDAVNPAVDDVAGLVFMGGPMSVNDNLPWIQAELDLIRRAAAEGIPMLGHCLGGQLISKALGGSVGPNAVKEIGWHTVEKIDNPMARVWLEDLPRHFEVYHWHGETFSLPAGAEPLLRSAYCREQAFVKNNILAFQCHVEMTADMVETWARDNPAGLAQPSASVQTAAEMTADLRTRVRNLNRIADVFYTRWLRDVRVAAAASTAP